MCLALAGRGQGFEAWPGTAINPSRGSAKLWKIPEDERDEQLRDEQLSSPLPHLPPLPESAPLSPPNLHSLGEVRSTMQIREGLARNRVCVLVACQHAEYF